MNFTKVTKGAHGYLGPVPKTPTQEVMMFGNMPYKIHRIMVYYDLVTENELDDYSEGRDEIEKIFNTEKMQWIMVHAIESPQWRRHIDHITWSQVFTVTAKLKDPDYVVYTLKFQ